MILVRTEFQCKWGRTQEVIEQFKGMAQTLNDQQVVKSSRILTDLSGQFDTVIVESEIESIDAYMAMLRAAFADPAFQGLQAGDGDNHPYKSGQRTFYTIEATFTSAAE